MREKKYTIDVVEKGFGVHDFISALKISLLCKSSILNIMSFPCAP